MPFLPVHSDQEISHIAAPYLTWGAILVCVAAHVAISTAPAREAAGILHQFGFIAGTLFGNLPQQALPFALPETATLLTYAFFARFECAPDWQHGRAVRVRRRG